MTLADNNKLAHHTVSQAECLVWIRAPFGESGVGLASDSGTFRLLMAVALDRMNLAVVGSRWVAAGPRRFLHNGVSHR